MDEKRDSCLVVIIKQQGSAPRGSGSVMLVGKAGHLAGTIGGGAVEKNSEILAAKCIEEKQSLVHEFSLSPGKKEDIGMVCGGEVTVLFQYISGTDAAWRETAETIISRYHERKDGWLVLDLDGGSPSVIDVLPPQTSGGNGCSLIGKSFSMPLNTGERAILFGAGHCGYALAPILDSVGFRVVVFDNRPEFADPERIPCADRVICGDFCRISDYIEPDPEDYIVIMTSGHAFDRIVEKQVLTDKKAYVGVIGSSKKIAAVNKQLLEEGISEDVLREVYTPIGLPIKAATPEEIAVSIAGEMIRVRANRRLGIEDHPTHQPVH